MERNNIIPPSNKRSYKITKQQLETLRLLYKFRFLTTQLLAQYRNLTKEKSARDNLTLLVQRGYVLKRYDRTYKIRGKYASYSLSPASIAYLRQSGSYAESVLLAQYKNRTVSDGYIDEHIDTARTAITLRDRYPDTFDIFTRYEIVNEEYFPSPRPDLYLRRRQATPKGINEYMLIKINESQLFIVKKQIMPYIKHFDEEGWNGNYPTLLLILTNSSAKNRVKEYLQHLELDDDFRVLITTYEALIESDNPEIWTLYQIDQMLTLL